MKRIILALIALMFISSQAFAKFETSTLDAESAVLYGKTAGGVLVPIKVDSSGNVSTSGGGSSTVATYEGLIATRGAINNNISVNTQMGSRTPHISRDSITALKVAFPNWYVQKTLPQPELGTGGTMTITASVEYPAGTFTQITFGGSASGSIPDASTLISDYIPVTIPINTLFYIRTYITDASGLPYYDESSQNYSSFGTAQEKGTSGITDKTMSGTITGSGDYYSPLAIIGFTNKPSFIILGDSITAGFGDVTADSTLDYGIGARYIGGTYAYSNFGLDNDKGNSFINFGTYTLRSAIFKYASHLLCDYGRNDIDSLGVDQQGLLLILRKIWDLGHANNMSVIQMTIGPTTDSTDGWATLGNQTVSPTNWSTTKEGYKVAFNDALRINYAAYGLSGYYDYALGIESSLDSGLWTVTGGATTTDGIHPNSHGNKLVRDTANLISNTIKGCTAGDCPPGTSVTYSPFGGGSSGSSIWTGPNPTYLTNGNVGIGTSTPANTLSLFKSGMSESILLGQNSSNTTYGILSFNGSSSTSGSMGIYGGDASDLTMAYNVPTGGAHKFRINGSTKVFIDSTGNMGIGNTSPGQTLDVTGTIRATNFSNVGIGATAGSGQLVVKSATANNGFLVGTVSDATTFGVASFNSVVTNAGTLGFYSDGTTLYSNIPTGADFRFRVNGSTKMDLNGSGNLGIGSVTPGQVLDVVGTTRSTQFIASGIGSDATKTDATVCEDTTTHQFYSGSGTLGICLGTSTMLAKQNIVPISEGIVQLMALKPVSFNYRAGWGFDPKKPYYGFLAEDVDHVLPRLVGHNDKGAIRNADYVGMIPIMVKSIQQMHHEQEQEKLIFLVIIVMMTGFIFFRRGK